MSDPSRTWYRVENADQIPSPALLVYPDRVDSNIACMRDAVDGDVSRLRPHVKTHKMAEVVERQRAAGIDRFKCATIAEAEMTAEAGASDVLLAYQPVGPNIGRMVSLCRKFPETLFRTVVDDPDQLDRITAVLSAEGETLDLLVDIDCGMGRTGIAPGDAAVDLCRRICEEEGVNFAGLHVYDGHIHDTEVVARGSHFDEARHLIEPFLADLGQAGIEIPLVVGGGSPTFPWHARLAAGSAVRYECSPGTTLFWDAGYGTNHPDLDFQVAALLLARVLSKPGEGRLCLELGHKAVAGENPLENRVRFPEIPDARPLSQSEEHLVIETSKAGEFSIGDVVYGIPWHICPTVALHQEAVVIERGQATGERWAVRARDRRITI